MPSNELHAVHPGQMRSGMARGSLLDLSAAITTKQADGTLAAGAPARPTQLPLPLEY